MPLVGLTGGMGAGKSTALRLLGELGAETLSTDAVVHELYAHQRVRDAVVERWGPDVAGPGGAVDRSQVAAHAFASEADRAWLEQLLWPLVGERMMQWAAGVRAKGAAAAVIEVPLLFESGMDPAFDATIAVIVPEELRRERADGRGHVLAGERHSRQLSQEQKAQRATFVVRNDRTVQDMRRDLAAILAKLSE